MRVLFLSPVQPLLTPGQPLPKWQMQASWVRALTRQGHEVRVIKYTPDDKIKLGWGERAAWNLRVVREVGEVGGADLIIYSLGADVLLPQTIRYIKARLPRPARGGPRNDGVKLVVLSGVSPIKDGNPRERATAPLVDLAATNDRGHGDEWLELGAKRAVVLPIAGIDPELHWERGIRGNRGTRGGDRDIDVAFVGTLTAERKSFLEKLRRLLPDAVKMVIKEFVWEEEYAELMSRAKIVVNPIRPEMAEGANLRMFEIPAFGGLELSSFGKKEWLIPGKEILAYGNEQEAAGLIVRYLRDDKARREMAEAGRKRVVREHTFDKRAEKLMEMI